MQGRKDIHPKMMYQFNIYMLVPADNFYLKLSQKLDLSFLYKYLWEFCIVNFKEQCDENNHN
jgi:hypothetical protein